MTKPKTALPSTKTSPPEKPERRTLILFGVDENQKPRAAWFIGDELALLAKAAEVMKLTICDVKSPELVELAQKLPAGRLHANGRCFVPYVRQDLYDALIAAAGGDVFDQTNPPTPEVFPRSFDDIGPGHLVIAQETLEFGWWEAIVLERHGDMLTMRFRDYPKLPKFRRHRSAVALTSPPPQ
jgi:hypothetical protein